MAARRPAAQKPQSGLRRRWHDRMDAQEPRHAGRTHRGGDDMSQIDAPVDVDVLRSEIQKTYTEVSSQQDGEFIFPTGRGWAQELGYPEPELSRVPDASVESFAGVANHWLLGRLEPGQTIVDLGCGAGTDLLIAAQMVGPEGRGIGVDMTPAMIDRAGERTRHGTRQCRGPRGVDRDAAARRRLGRRRDL